MRKALVLALVSAYIGIAVFETCTNNNDCSNTTQCDSVTEVQCTNGTCTCELREGFCDSRGDCLNMQNWFCPAELRHCIDQHCRCRFM
ncbi:serine protease inhibitor Cvsi-2-like [Ostrea edulis]|uniref:serine protease inhibitor Cvsi-2-like n=1 Tax=Ostrea edulis TaxID=37623 RepID=UPI0020943811|nr:serine protease inhibitor Cvsi-2-like [Ostrea edulis]